MAEFEHIRGDSFFVDGQFQTTESLATWTVRAQIRASHDGPLIDTFQFSWTNAATGEYRLQKLNTTAWPITPLLFDVEIKHPTNGRVHSSGVHKINTVLDVSHD